jgi:hypothetical protein
VPYENSVRRLNVKLRKENILKLTIGNEKLPQDSNDNGARLVNFVTSKS